MHIRLKSLPVILILFLLGCGESESDSSLITHEEPAPVLSIPGTIQLPGNEGFTLLNEQEHQTILLYCWIPIGQYPESETDLYFLGTLEEMGIQAVPIQFSSQVRNASQDQMNSLGIPLAVALGDDSLRNFMPLSKLPAAVLVQSTGEVCTETGFGCAERVVRSIR